VKNLVALFALVASFFVCRNGMAQDDSLSWSFAPYLWASDTKLDLTWRSSPVGGADISFGDLVDTLEAAAMFQLEAGRGNWSSFLDLTYLSTSDASSSGQLELAVDSKQWFVDVSAGYWPTAFGTGLNVFGGIRYTGFDTDYDWVISGSPALNRGSSQNYADVLVGIRYIGTINERWGYLVRGDTSFGDSEGTWLARAVATYAVGGTAGNRVVFGYQFKSAEFRDREITTDYSYRGLLVGIQFQF
jgi:hypothetical protein